MSGIDKYVVGQCEKLFADAVEQCPQISSREVCPADASLEKYVAGKQTSGFWAVEDKASR